HFDHNAIDVVSKERTRVFKMFYGESVIDNVKVIGLKTYHDKQMGRRRGENAVYIVEARGFRIAHLGDLGEIPSKDVLDKLAKVDLLIVPVGGTFTIEPQEGWRIIEATSPLNVMPIHYWISGLTLPLKPIDEFLKYISNYNVVKLDTNTFNLRDYKKTVIVAKPPR
ncbi:MAG: MBL fold metallo-hydrolase, partial [Desulfurococcaceae archaeon]